MIHKGSSRDMAQETNQTQGPMLCATGCGFYGNPRTNGMCSVCYKDHLQRQNSSGRVSPPGSSGASSVVEFQSSQRLDHSSTVVAEVPSAIGSLEPRSGVSSQALFSPDEDSTWDKEGLKTHELQVGAPEGAAVSNLISELEEFPLDRDPISISSESGIQYKKPGQERPRAGGDKRKRSEAPEPVGAPVLEDSDWTSAVGKGPPPDRPKPRKNRCFLCRKKVGLTGFDCRCGNVFCGIHRYSDIHSCTFDYKADAAEKIRKENPVVVGEKIQKI